MKHDFLKSPSDAGVCMIPLKSIISPWWRRADSRSKIIEVARFVDNSILKAMAEKTLT
jgi:hypothetical protein